MMGTVRARVRGVNREGGRTVLQAVDDAGREYAIEVPEGVAGAPRCSTCGPACGCAPCRLRHGDAGETHDHDHDHDHDHELVLVLAWSLHEMPSTSATHAAPKAEHAVAAPARAADPQAERPPTAAEIRAVDAAFMALCAPQPSAARKANTSVEDVLDFLTGPTG